MLSDLFGNRNIERILLYLLINGRCYAGKLARHFKTSLTPFQQALIKLEQIGIIESVIEGNIRYFQFKESCPYLDELETLLRKVFTLFNADLKKEYYDNEFQPTRDKKKRYSPRHLVIEIWNKLYLINHLTFTSESHKQGGHSSEGKGEVMIRKINDCTLIFDEKGTWISKDQQEFKFTNVFRWTYDPFQNQITLEHLRFGEKNPVFLFHLAQINDLTLQSVSSYVCKEDSYLGQVQCDEGGIKLNWRILGPKKNDEINYFYF